MGHIVVRIVQPLGQAIVEMVAGMTIISGGVLQSHPNSVGKNLVVIMIVVSIQSLRVVDMDLQQMIVQGVDLVRVCVMVIVVGSVVSAVGRNVQVTIGPRACARIVYHKQDLFR